MMRACSDYVSDPSSLQIHKNTYKRSYAKHSDYIYYNLQGSTICVHRVRTYAYFIGVRMILNMRTLTRTLIFP